MATEFECPHCNQPLDYDDSFGKIVGWNGLLNEPRFDFVGDIYRCNNGDSDHEGTSFYAYYNDNELIEGYPC